MPGPYAANVHHPQYTVLTIDNLYGRVLSDGEQLEELSTLKTDSNLTLEIFIQTTKRVAGMWSVEYCPTSSILGSIVSQDIISFIKDPALLKSTRFILYDSLSNTAKSIA